MGKRMLILLIVLAVIFVIFRFCGSRPEPAQSEEKPSPIAISENSGVFNSSYAAMLESYYRLKDAFVASDTAAANAAALRLRRDADSLKLQELQGDTSGMIAETAALFTQTISSSSLNLASTGNIEDKRHEFEGITDAVWSLTRTVRYDGQKVYYQFCPMAFNNKGAYWLSDAREIRNPYFGDKMLKCGKIADSLDYAAGR